jgi:diaminohydroxyphosphoribosylaminopyrimidine deaminase/5-amino-6-(5-phosphoribosylamino)uracil reductase
MLRCLELAALGELYTAPNPMVGCVIVYKGEIVAEGYHHRYGDAHAEVNAFKNLPEYIDSTKCTVYVSLEPCSHYGKTPPCANLLVDKKPKRVVIGMLDPNSKVCGKGMKKLLEAGINISVGILEDACKALNKKFIKAHTTQLPFVTLKWAETANGFMARDTDDKRSAKISDIVNNALVHQLRATHQAILAGANTINTDTPKLNIRDVEGRNPIKIVLSEKLNINLDSKTLTEGKTLIYNAIRSEMTENYELIKIKKCTLHNVLADMHSRDIHSVLVEGGSQVLASFVEDKVWDEAVILKSSTRWENGIKAPWLGIPSTKEKASGNDTIKYFLSK